MAASHQYLLNRGGRFFARLVVPKELRQIIGKTELRAPLGPDRRTAVKLLPAAVATLQSEIRQAQRKAGITTKPRPTNPITTADYGRAVWQRYMAALSEDEAARSRYPTPAAIEAAQDRLMQHFQREGIPADPLAILDQSLDWLVLKDAQAFDHNARQVRLEALRKELATAETHQVEHEIDAYLDRHSLTAPPGSAERVTLAKHLMRAEIEALQRSLERDRGDYGGQPSDAIVRPPADATEALEPVNIKRLWRDYVQFRTAAGFMKDGGRRVEVVIESLCKFLKHSDARRVVKKDLLDWRDHLIKTLAAKTVNDVYLSAVRSMFKWAHENERLPENPAATVKQPKPKRQRTREAGYTDAEAITVLKASRTYQPKADEYGRIRETPESVDARRWVPILCAFTGARVSEMTQLRKEDVRQEGDKWVIRITPEAGTMKAGHYRDVPLHRQVIAQGFIRFVEQAKDGPLFHNGTDPAKFAAKAQRMSNAIADWLRLNEIKPDGVQPSHAWRHRFKTIARDIGADSRITDAIQGHASRTAADDYGDVSIIAKARVIDALPDYNLNE